MLNLFSKISLMKFLQTDCLKTMISPPLSVLFILYSKLNVWEK